VHDGYAEGRAVVLHWRFSKTFDGGMAHDEVSFCGMFWFGRPIIKLAVTSKKCQRSSKIPI
jgi:hypothetical protein